VVFDQLVTVEVDDGGYDLYPFTTSLFRIAGNVAITRNDPTGHAHYGGNLVAKKESPQWVRMAIVLVEDCIVEIEEKGDALSGYEGFRKVRKVGQDFEMDDDAVEPFQA
jgi:hypothetical protein